LGTERHEARRIDNQLRGRSGRQGDEGETQFFVSMDDSLMRVIGGARVQSLIGTFKIPEDQPIEMGMISRTLENAQTKIEGFHFDSRKQVLAYDNVLNQQRQVIYARRRKLLQSDEEEIAEVLKELYAAYPETEAIITAKKAEFGEAVFTDVLRRLLLQMIDMLWVEHLEVMGFTRSSVGLRAYGQRDPLIEYRKEGLRLFKEMQDALIGRVAEVLPRVQPQEIVKAEAQRREAARAAQDAAGVSQSGSAKKVVKQEPVQKEKQYARNDIVTITDGSQTQELKYKKAEDLLTQGWSVVQK
jgi:preprotein translocase subunit SecA